MVPQVHEGADCQNWRSGQRPVCHLGKRQDASGGLQHHRPLNAGQQGLQVARHLHTQPWSARQLPVSSVRSGQRLLYHAASCWDLDWPRLFGTGV